MKMFFSIFILHLLGIRFVDYYRRARERELALFISLPNQRILHSTMIASFEPMCSRLGPTYYYQRLLLLIY